MRGALIERGKFILGDEVRAFEDEFADYAKASHAIGVNSGTDALIIVLRAANVGPGDEVLVPGFSFIATAEAVAAIGADLRFIDICLEDFNINAEALEANCSNRTRAVIPVHMFGMPANMTAISQLAARKGWAVVEDCAHASGLWVRDSHAGTTSNAGAFSFFPTKNLGAIGDAGAILTDDESIADKCKRLRTHGTERKYWSIEVGYNSRLDEVQAAILRIRLTRLDALNAARKKIAEKYYSRLNEISEVALPRRVDEHVYHQFTIRVPRAQRDALLAWLRDREIEAQVYYPHTLDRMPAYSRWRREKDDLPMAKRATEEVLSLPLRPYMPESEVNYVADAMQAFFEQRDF